MNTKEILRKVKRDYAAIAEEFDVTRQAPWPEFETFWKAAEKHSLGSREPQKLLDAGCGNGRLFSFLEGQNIEYTGVDNNLALLRIARRKFLKARFLYGDILRLPFSPGSFDAVWCVAVIHHLPTAELQLKALRKMRTLLRKNGLLIITAWNLWQPKYKKFIQKKTNLAEIPWGEHKKTSRMYYAFTEKGLKELLKLAGFTKLRKVASRHNFAYIAYAENSRSRGRVRRLHKK